MIHPHTELRAVDPRIGFGVVATRRIPKGTITWVRDGLDQSFSAEQVAGFDPILRPMLDRYSYRDASGIYVLSWDNGRYVNHSCDANCMDPGFDIELAVRDIQPGEQLTGDYGAYNLADRFACFCGAPNCRGRVEPVHDPAVIGRWDAAIGAAFPLLRQVEQPLWRLVQQQREIEHALSEPHALPSSARVLMR